MARGEKNLQIKKLIHSNRVLNVLEKKKKEKIFSLNGANDEFSFETDNKLFENNNYNIVYFFIFRVTFHIRIFNSQFLFLHLSHVISFYIYLICFVFTTLSIPFYYYYRYNGVTYNLN